LFFNHQKFDYLNCDYFQRLRDLFRTEKTKKIERIQHFLRKKNDDIILIDVTDKFINDDATLKASHGVT